MAQENLKYKRVIIKLSGEALAGENGTGIDAEKLTYVCKEIADVKALGVDVGIVIGGGNFWRGRQADDKMNRSTADHMGMLATVMNALAIQDKLEQLGVPVRVQTALTITKVAEPYILRKAIRHFERVESLFSHAAPAIRIFHGHRRGTPCLRNRSGRSSSCQNVDGVYDSDPKLNPQAKKFSEISYMDVIQKGLKAMDTTAITMCMDNNIPIVVFALMQKDSIRNAVYGVNTGTIIH